MKKRVSAGSPAVNPKQTLTSPTPAEAGRTSGNGTPGPQPSHNGAASAGADSPAQGGGDGQGGASGQRWTVKAVLEYASRHWKEKQPDDFAMMPRIGADHGPAFLARVLFHLWLDGDFPHLPLTPRPAPDDLEDEEESEEALHDEIDEARMVKAFERWGESCVPPWPPDVRREVRAELGRKLQCWQNARDAGPGWEGVSAAEFAAERYAWDWVVEGLLLPGQPVVLGGPLKTLKTGLAVDLAVSLGSATRFLGEFRVPARVGVSVFSGESGRQAIHDLTGRVCATRGVSPCDLATQWRFQVPSWNGEKELQVLRGLLEHDGLMWPDCERLCIIDPAYLCMEGSKPVDATNVFKMGALLNGAARACLAAGFTPLVVYHTGKNVGHSTRPLELHQLAYAGIAEFARQWILVNRRSQFQHDGRHELLINYGGSAGHQGLRAVTVEEGVRQVDGSGMGWKVSVGPYERGCRGKDKHEELGERVLAALDELAGDPGAGASRNQVREKAGLSDKSMKKALKELGGQVEVYDGEVVGGKGARQKAKMIRRRAGGVGVGG